MRRRMLFAALIGLLLLGGCSNDDPTVDGGDEATEEATEDAGEAAVIEVAVDAADFRYEMPEEIEAGLVEFTMKNVGKELHIAALGKVDAGKTFADVAKDLQSPTPPADPASEEVGGIASTSPGLSSTVALVLEPGTYYFACFIPSADGAPHTAKGMVQEFEVTEVEEVAEPPAEDGRVTTKDFSFTTDYQVKAGEQVIRLDNQGGQGHEITLMEFAAGKGPADLQAYFEKPEGPPPATFYGGPVVGVGKQAIWTTPALVAGRSYVFMCLIPDPADGIPHAAKGMILPVQVT